MSKDIVLVDSDLIEVDDEDKNKNRFSLVKDTPLKEQILLNVLQRTPSRFVRSRPGKGGRAFNYVTGGYVKKMLNYTFGWLWDSEVIRSENVVIDGKIIEIVVDVRCTFRVWDEKTNSYLSIIKTQAGGAEVKYLKGTNIPMDFANDRKAAITDGVKKCAAELGLASDVYNADEYKDVDPDIANEIKSKAEPKKSKTKLKMEVDNSEPEVIPAEVVPEPEPTPEPVVEKTQKEVVDEEIAKYDEMQGEEKKKEVDQVIRENIKKVRENLTAEEKESLAEILRGLNKKKLDKVMLAFTNPLFDDAGRLAEVKEVLAVVKPDTYAHPEEPKIAEADQSVLKMMENGELEGAYENPVKDPTVDKKTDAQNKKMFALWNEYLTLKGVQDALENKEISAQYMKTAIRQVINKTVASRSELTVEDSSRFIEALEDRVRVLKEQNPSS